MNLRLRLIAALMSVEAAAGGINPFTRPPDALLAGRTEGGSAEMVLRGVVVAGSRSIANIAGTVVVIGEEYQGFVLAEVADTKVVLEKNGETLELRLPGTED